MESAEKSQEATHGREGANEPGQSRETATRATRAHRRYKTRGKRGEGKTLQETISGSSADAGTMMIRRVYLQIPRACG
jgi:hypothetical protein